VRTLLASLKWVFEKFVDIAVDVVAGIILYLILGGYISQPLSIIFPQLPSILAVTLVLAVVLGFIYRFYKSVRFHRFIETTYSNLFDFLKDWDKLGNAFNRAINSHNEDLPAIKEFEDTRTLLLYRYPKISSAAKLTSYDYIDRFQGVVVKNYDVIGNHLAKSPFTRMEWFNMGYASKDFNEGWDSGRTVLVATIGYFDCYRQGTLHIIYWDLHLVPFPKKKEQENNA